MSLINYLTQYNKNFTILFKNIIMNECDFIIFFENKKMVT